MTHESIPRHTALITGASAGIGAEFARQLAAQQKNLVLVARRMEPMQALADELQRSYGITIDILPADLSDPHVPRQLFEETERRGLQIDYLINNAGSAGPDLLEDRDWAVQRAYFELMMISVPAMCHLYIPGMIARQFGRIVNVASVAARIPRKGDCNYGPAKAYLVSLSEGLSLTLRHQGINTLALCPGFTHTEFHEKGNLMDMKRAIPGFLWYDADVVVGEGLRALEKGKAVYVSGRLYRWMDPLFQSTWTRRFFSIRRKRDLGNVVSAQLPGGKEV